MEQKMTGIEIDKAEFGKLDSSKQNAIIFNNTERLIEMFESHLGTCNKRFIKIENRKKFDTGISGGSGLIGGAITYILFKVFGIS
jgi:hypothetical protein